MVTIISKEIVGDYVHVVLSNGEEIDISVDWATKFIQEAVTNPETGEVTYQDTDKSLLQHEIEQAPIQAQARIEKTAADDQAAQYLLNSM